MEIDPAALSRTETYKLLSGAIVPRPIAWVSSQSESGVVNLAPFSTFNWVSVAPAMVGFSVARRPERFKDTARNIAARKEYVINIADQTLLEPLHQSAEEYAPEQSELHALGLTAEPSCLVPGFCGVFLSSDWKGALWDKFVMAAPRPRTPSELQYSDRKLRSRS